MRYLLFLSLLLVAALIGVPFFLLLPEPATPGATLAPLQSLFLCTALWAPAVVLIYRVVDSIKKLDDVSEMSQYKRRQAAQRGTALQTKAYEIATAGAVLSLLTIVAIALEVTHVLPYGSALSVGFGTGIAGLISFVVLLRWDHRVSAVVREAKRRAQDIERGRALAEKLRPKTNGA